LFFGEEPTMAARLWTHGFDCFAPPQVRRRYDPPFPYLRGAEFFFQRRFVICFCDSTF